jgi:uncharacterized protein (TIGR03067 family)
MSCHTTAVLLTVLPLAPPALPAPKGLSALRGEWVLVSTTDVRRVTPGIDECRMVIGADGRVALKVGELTTNRGTIKVGLSGKLKHIDMRLTSGLVRGVYELKGDELAICYDEPGKPRPAGMRPQGTEWVVRWRRVRRLDA